MVFVVLVGFQGLWVVFGGVWVVFTKKHTQKSQKKTKNKKATQKAIQNTTGARMVAGPHRIGVGPGFDSQGSVIFLLNTAFPT